MQKYIASNIALLILCALFPAHAHSWSGKVISVHDGDTITVSPVSPQDSMERVKVRLYGIDTPELGQPLGPQAKAMTERILLGKVIEIVPTQKARSYKREVAGIVMLDALVVVQDVLVSTGLAWVDDRYCKLAVCDLWRMHQEDAKKATPPRGLWADDSPIPPWQWRRMKKSKK